MPKSKACHAAVFAGLLAAVGLSAASPARAGCNLVGVAQAVVTMDGLTPLVPAKIDRAQTRLILDTGSFYSILTPNTAKKLALPVGGLPLLVRFEGVNGGFRAGFVNVAELGVFGRPFKDIGFLVGGPEFGRDVSGLLGQNFLNLDDEEYDLANGAMRIFRPQGCEGANLAYWAAGQSYSVIPISRVEQNQRSIRGQASVNGVIMRVVFDTGSPHSYMTLQAAARAGIRPDDPGVTRGGPIGGLGRGLIETWIAPVKSFKIGDEEVRNTRVRIGKINLPDADMLIGADFFLSHRIFVANSQRRLYLTYNGGPVFNLDSTAAAPAPASPTDLPGSAAADVPKDADGLARRGRAFAARHEYAQAIADLNRAIELDPNAAQHRFDRGQVYAEQKQFKLALADFDAALQLEPKNVDMRLARAAARLKNAELAGARADFDAAMAQDPSLQIDIAARYAGDGDFEDAVALYDKVLASKPDERRRLQALDGRCWARALWNRDLDKALEDCNAALRVSPTWDDPLGGRAMVRLRLGQYDRAFGDFDRVVRDGAKTGWMLYGRGLARRGLGKTKDAEADLKTAAELDPDLPAKAKSYGLPG